jgi:hypothetical protein
MELKDTGKDYLDLDFEIPQSGVSVVQFEEGIQKRTNESSGKTTLQLPMVIDRVIEGPEDNAGKKMSHFVPIETGFGEKQLAGILTITGLMGAFSKKFGADVDVTDDTFVNALKLKLPGKFITATHEVRKDNSGKDRVNVIRFEKVSGGGSPKASPAQKGTGAAPAGGGGDDWE